MTEQNRSSGEPVSQEECERIYAADIAAGRPCRCVPERLHPKRWPLTQRIGDE